MDYEKVNAPEKGEGAGKPAPKLLKAIFILAFNKGESKMENETSIDYKLVLADLEAKLVEHKAKCKCAELEAAIAAVKRILGYADVPLVPLVSPSTPFPAAGSPPPEASSWNGRSETIPDDAFFKMGMIDATIKYLRIVKKKRGTKEIATALERGGFAHQSKNFYITLWNTLNRVSKEEGSEIVKMKTVWALREWYPDMK